jgi:hypothetical protein
VRVGAGAASAASVTAPMIARELPREGVSTTLPP